MTHCRAARCAETAHDHVLVPDGPDDEVRRVELDACGCTCPACDWVNVDIGWRAPSPAGQLVFAFGEG